MTLTLHVPVLPFEDLTVIVAVPVDFPVTIPSDVIAAIPVFDDEYITVLSVALLGIIVTLNFSDLFTPTLSEVQKILLTEITESGLLIGLPHVFTVNCLDSLVLLPELSVTV